MELYLGCTQLKKLYIDLESLIDCSNDDYQDKAELLKFLFELWKKMRPGLAVDYTSDFPYYSVMDML